MTLTSEMLSLPCILLYKKVLGWPLSLAPEKDITTLEFPE
jgi:hypothetical protein